MKKIINNKKLIVGLIFIIYLLMLCYHLFLSDSIGKREIAESYRYNFTLFKEILRYIRNINVIGVKLVFINIIGNVVAFVPFGIFVGYFLKNSKYTFLKTILLGLVFTVAIEGIQLLTRVGICDVDDILLNFIGVVTGGMFSKIFNKNN